jgi:hypothetical protein
MVNGFAIEIETAAINASDLEKIDETAASAPEGSLIGIVEPTAMAAKKTVDGKTKWSWELTAVIIVRTGCMRYQKWQINANAPWIDMTVEAAKEYWAKMVAEIVAVDLIEEMERK